MELKFTKMHGCGNDYIYINCFGLEIVSPESLTVRLSDRHRGIGGDGLVLIMPSAVADAKMRMFNRDGSEGGMCGSAIRCVAKYLYENKIAREQKMRIETLSGVRELELSVENRLVYSVRVNMGPAELAPEKIPANFSGKSVIARPVTIGGREYAMTCVSVGNPHAVIFCTGVDELDLWKIGPLFENSGFFPDGVNVEFVDVVGERHLKVRVWERGSGETLACGTGACAAVVAAVLNAHCNKAADISVCLPGGELTVSYTDTTVYLTGDCVKVFEGTVEI